MARRKVKAVDAVMSRHEDELLAIPGVEGVAIGEAAGEACIKVYVARKTRALAARVPRSLDGIPIAIETAGEFFAR